MSVRRVRNVWIADTARVIGDVVCGDDVSFWYGVVVRGDVAQIRIGAGTNVQDHTVLHCDTGVPMTIGADVTIGHSAVVHCSSVGDGTLIGIGARVLANAVIGRGCLIAAGAVVSPGTVVPDGMLVRGLPGRILRPLEDDERRMLAEIPPGYRALAARHAAGEFPPPWGQAD
jgi:carbonic anhydrase/acetyltransferase-like protein (isoleucine patch superfamily)